MILSVSMKDFRGIADRQLTFGPRKNLIRGPNESGKTTIAHLISFGFYGVDAYGGKNPDHLITQGKDSCEVAIQTEHATFIRKKKRGAASTLSIVRAGCPDLKPNQTELVKLLGLEYDLFASTFKVGYFMALSDLKKREVISQAWKADRPALLKQLLTVAGGQPVWPERLVKLANPRLDSDNVAKERQGLQNQLLVAQGELNSLKAQIAEAMALPSDSESLRAKEVELSRLRAEVQLVDLYENDLRKYQSATTGHAEREAENKRRLAKQDKLMLEVKALGPIPVAETVDLEAKHTQLQKSIVECKPLGMPDEPAIRSKVMEDNCLRCGQRVPENMKKSISDERDRLLIEFNQKQRTIADQNAETMRKREAFEQEASQVQKQIQAKKQAKMEWEQKHRYLAKSLEDIVIQPNPLPNAPERPACLLIPAGMEGPKEKLGKLEAEYQAQKLLEGRATTLAAREKDLTVGITQRTSQIAELQTLQDCLRKLPDVEVEATMSRFKLHKAQVAFLEGEVVVADERGIPYLSLSDGRRMKVDVEWVKCFKRLVPKGPNFMFIDNADLVDSFDDYWPEESTQVFLVQVKAELKQLEVVQL